MSHPYLAAFQQDEWPINTQITTDYIDEQLSEITGFWAAGKLESIIQYVKELVDQDIYDIRLLTFYFYSLWVTDSTCSLHQILSALQKLLKQPPNVWILENDEENKSEEQATSVTLSESAKKQLQTSLNLFFVRTEQRLSHYSDEPEYEEALPCKIIKYNNKIASLLSEKYGLSEISPLIKQLNLYFNDACEKETADEQAIEKINDLTVNTEEPPTEEKAVNEDKPIKSNTVNTQTPQHVEAEQHLPQAQASTQNYSPALQQLLNKLQIFETLMQEKNTYKASIVFESIQQELQQFNPLHYLPELFSGYAKTHALFATELNQLIQQHNNTHSQALKDYFAIDPNGFLQLEIEPQTQESQGEFQAISDTRFDDREDDFGYDD